MSMQLRGWTWILAVSVVVSLCLMPKPVKARDVLDILREKDIITQQEYEEAKEEAKREAEKSESPVKWRYRFGRGFTVDTKDGNNQLYIGSRFQFRHTFEDRDGSDDRSSFRVRRAKLWFRGHVYRPWIKYKLQGAFDSGEDGEFEMEDYYFDIAYYKPLTLRAGQYKVPFNRQELTSSSSLQFVDRALANEQFNLDYDLGSMIHGGFMDLVNYNFSVQNGAGKNDSANDNNGMLYAVRVDVTPLGKFEYYSEGEVEHSKKPGLGIGGAFAYNRKTTSAGRGDDTLAAGFEQADISQATVDIGFKWLGFSLFGDYFWRDADPRKTGFKDSETTGYTVQAGYFVIPERLEIVGRYSRVNYDDEDQSADPFGRRREGMGGINYYFKGHPLKLQFDIGETNETFRTPGKADSKEIGARTQLQIIF